MRYLFFHYSWTVNRTKRQPSSRGDGNLFAAFSLFPSNNLVKAIARPLCPIDAVIVVTGWQEFKSREDFFSFTDAKEISLDLEDSTDGPTDGPTEETLQ